MDKAKVWRGLTNLVDENDNLVSENNSQTRINNFINWIANLVKENVQSRLVLILFVTSLTLNGFLFQQWIVQNQTVRELQYQLENLQKKEQEINQQIKDKQEINQQIQNLQNQLQEKDQQIEKLSTNN